MRAILLATALALAPAAAFAEIAISGNDGKQVRAGDGLPMVPTPDSVSVIEFSSRQAPRIIGIIDVCATQMGPPSAIAVAQDYSFVLSACPQKFGADNKLGPDNKVAVIDRACQCAFERTQRDRTPQKSKTGADHKEYDGGNQHAGGKRGAADMMSLHVIGKRQLHAGSSLGDRSSIATVRLKKGKCSSLLDANAAIARTRPNRLKSSG